MKRYQLDTTLQECTGTEPSGRKFVTLLTREEFAAETPHLPHRKTLLHYMTHMQYCRAELFGGCILGTLSIPAKKVRQTDKLQIGFYLLESNLYLIGNPEQLSRLIGRMRDTEFRENISTAGFFCLLLNLLIDSDALFLQEIEDALSQMEEETLTGAFPDFYGKLVPYRASLRALDACYSQLESMGGTIRANASQLLSDEERVMYGYFFDRVARLSSHTETLNEYAIQIREMHQTQIEVRQTKAMNLLTVVSAIFLPLSLLAGWYGMNFAHMPELQWPFGYPGVIVLSIVIVCAEIIFFRKKGLF